MNYLTHLYLSRGSYPEMLGNFIGDFVKGKQHQNFLPSITEGVTLHRLIDELSDRHPSHKACAQFFYRDYKRYAGIVADVVFDHILASRWEKYHQESLPIFMTDFYQSISKYQNEIPEKIWDRIQRIKAARRVESYAYLTGIHETLRLMSIHTSLPSFENEAVEILENKIDSIEEYYNDLLQDLQKLVIQKR